MATFAVLLLVMMMMATPAVMGDSDGPTFEELTQLVEALEEDAAEALTKLGELRTLCSFTQLRRADLLDRAIPLLRANNPRQDRAIDHLADQIKALQHRVDADEAQATETLEIARDTRDSSTSIANAIQNDVVDHDTSQQGEINGLTASIATIKEQFLANLTSTITNVKGQVNDLVDQTTDLAESVDEEKCEYGYASLSPGFQNVTFGSIFTSVPDVTLYLTSFKFSLSKGKQGYSHSSYGYDRDQQPDLLVVDKFVETTNTDGFVVNLVDESQGNVELLQAHCNWVACQNI